MAQAIKVRVFMRGRRQHVTIPSEFHFRSNQVAVRRDPESGNLILSEVLDIETVYAALDSAELPSDFMTDEDRDRSPLGVHDAPDRPFVGNMGDAYDEPG